MNGGILKCRSEKEINEGKLNSLGGVEATIVQYDHHDRWYVTTYYGGVDKSYDRASMMECFWWLQMNKD